MQPSTPDNPRTDDAGHSPIRVLDLFAGDIQGMADMGIGIGFVARLLGNAGDIVFIEFLQPRQAIAVGQQAEQDEPTHP
jgi:hypothetical protein